MNHSSHLLLKPNLFLTTLVGSFILASCGAPPPNMAKSNAPVAAVGKDSLTKESAPIQPNQGAKQIPQSPPQLVKIAEIALVVNSIDDSFRQASQIVKQQQGDVLGLQDDKSQGGSHRQMASLQIRVPQDNLEITLDALGKLGTLQRRQLTAVDVTTQLVDFQARLRNLRQTESSLLQIMNRAGSVGDILRVAQELSKVRESIEQIDAQLKSLTNRVAYSTITLQLESAVSTTMPQPPLGLQIQDSWRNAIHSVAELTTGLIRLAIWLLVYSPYLLLLGGASWFVYSRNKKR